MSSLRKTVNSIAEKKSIVNTTSKNNCKHGSPFRKLHGDMLMASWLCPLDAARSFVAAVRSAVQDRKTERALIRKSSFRINWVGA